MCVLEDETKEDGQRRNVTNDREVWDDSEIPARKIHNDNSGLQAISLHYPSPRPPRSPPQMLRRQVVNGNLVSALFTFHLPKRM